jgi:hypothetical protein
MGVVFHIGFPKTGTTTLQEVVRNHPDCAYLGKGLRDDMKPSLSLEVARAVFFADRARFRGAAPGLRDAVAALAAERDCLFISDEAFTFNEHMLIGDLWGQATVTDHEEIAERLSAIAPDARILVTIREQCDFLESFFFQDIKKGRPDIGFDSYLDREMGKRAQRGMLNLLRYDEVVEAYGAAFAPDRVTVFAHEANKADFAAYLGRVAEIVGVSGEAMLAAWAGRHMNARKTRRKTSPALRAIKRLTPRSLRAALPEAARGAMRERFTEEETPQEVWTAPRRQAVRALFGESNRRTAALSGLDLESLGYAF